MPFKARAIIAGARILQVAIFCLGGLAFLSADDGQWTWAAVWTVLALVCYFALSAELVYDMEEEDEQDG